MLLFLVLAATTVRIIDAGPEAQKQGIKKFKITQTTGASTDPEPWPRIVDGKFGPTLAPHPVPYTATVDFLNVAGAVNGRANVTYKPGKVGQDPYVKAGYDVNYTSNLPITTDVRLRFDEFGGTLDVTDRKYTTAGITVSAWLAYGFVAGADPVWKYTTNWITYYRAGGSAMTQVMRMNVLKLMSQMLLDTERPKQDVLGLRTECEKKNPTNPAICNTPTACPWDRPCRKSDGTCIQCPPMPWPGAADRAEACAGASKASTDPLLPGPDPSWCNGETCYGSAIGLQRQITCRGVRRLTDASLCCQNIYCLGCCDTVANQNGKPNAWCEANCIAIPGHIIGLGDQQLENFCWASTDLVSCSDNPPLLRQ